MVHLPNAFHTFARAQRGENHRAAAGLKDSWGELLSTRSITDSTKTSPTDLYLFRILTRPKSAGFPASFERISADVTGADRWPEEQTASQEASGNYAAGHNAGACGMLAEQWRT